jgi:lipopolysaccharide heptosyltransferase I
MIDHRILVVRLGAMGDIIHALPAVASLERIPDSHITWIVDPKWAPLLAGNSSVDRVISFDRKSLSSIRSAWRALRTERIETAVDLQGLVKSALVARASGAGRIMGFSKPREALASMFYTHKVDPAPVHVVDRNLALALAAGAPEAVTEFSIPDGRPEGDLPNDPFVLACPLAGWRSKQWPIEYYSELVLKGVPLVVNGPPQARAELEQVKGARLHLSGLDGLIDATRRASAVIGVDSGPLHIAAALGKPGVAIYGPTDPARNGPYGGTLTVLRDSSAVTSYKRGNEISAAMRAITPDQVLKVLR